MRDRRVHFVLLMLLVLGVTVVFGAAQARAVTFTRHDYSAGSAPCGLAIGDFNGDGFADVATDNAWTTNASVLLGAGDGSLAAPVTSSVYGNPFGMAAGDLNGDGKKDLVVVSQSGSVRVLLGAGDGTFTSAGDFAAGTIPLEVAIADFNGDGKPDLAVTNDQAASVSILLGKGDGTFEDKVDCATGAAPYGVAAADFNGDGNIDLAVACSDSSVVSILLGAGDGTFGAKTDVAAGNGALFVDVGDFNGDGDKDLAVADFFGDTVTTLMGAGDGTFSAGAVYASDSGPGGLAVGDLDGDGVQDLVVVARNADKADIYLGNGDGSFADKVVLATGGYPYNVGVADFDGNGKPDFVTVNDSGSTVSVFLNAGSMPAGTMTLDADNDATKSTTVTIDSSVTSAAQMRVRDGGGDWSDWQAYAAHTGWTVPAGDGSKAVDVEYRSHLGDVLALNDSIILDTVAPVSGTGDAPTGWVNASGLPLTVVIGSSDASTYVVSTEYRLDGATDWTEGSSVPVSGDGTHTIEYRSTDAAGNVEVAKTYTVGIDTAPPVTTDDAPSGWLTAAALPVTVHLTADAGLGSPIKSTEYRLDGASDWTDGASVPVSGNGVHAIDYRSTDAAGNVEDTKTCTVRIDAVRPTTSGQAVTVKRGKKAVFKVKVTDKVSGNPPQTVTIKVRNAKGKLLKTLSGFGPVTSNATTSLGWPHCKLAKGKYRYSVYATDAAGNRQSKAGGNRLVVK